MSISFAVFWLFGALILISVVLAVSVKNPIYSTFLLVSGFCITAIMSFGLGAEFLSFMIITIYVGAIVILFLFAIMMLNIDETLGKMRSISSRIVCIVIPLIIMTIILCAISSSILISDLNPKLQVSGSLLRLVGIHLYGEYHDILIALGILLLLGIVGPVSITIDFVRKSKRNISVDQQVLRNASNSVELVQVQSGAGIQY